MRVATIKGTHTVQMVLTGKEIRQSAEHGMHYLPDTLYLEYRRDNGTMWQLHKAEMSGRRWSLLSEALTGRRVQESTQHLLQGTPDWLSAIISEHTPKD